MTVVEDRMKSLTVESNESREKLWQLQTKTESLEGQVGLRGCFRSTFFSLKIYMFTPC